MEKTILFLLLLPAAALGQNIKSDHQANADSLVTYFLGKEIFRQYVQLDAKRSQARSNSFLFQYNLRHPKFSGKTHVIKFALDATGQFIPNEEAHGLINIASLPDSSWFTGQQALNTCKDESERLKTKSLRLLWDPVNVSYDTFQKTHDYRDITPGDLFWA